MAKHNTGEWVVVLLHGTNTITLKTIATSLHTDGLRVLSEYSTHLEIDSRSCGTYAGPENSCSEAHAARRVWSRFLLLVLPPPEPSFEIEIPNLGVSNGHTSKLHATTTKPQWSIQDTLGLKKLIALGQGRWGKGLPVLGTCSWLMLKARKTWQGGIGMSVIQTPSRLLFLCIGKCPHKMISWVQTWHIFNVKCLWVSVTLQCIS